MKQSPEIENLKVKLLHTPVQADELTYEFFESMEKETGRQSIDDLVNTIKKCTELVPRKKRITDELPTWGYMFDLDEHIAAEASKHAMTAAVFWGLLTAPICFVGAIPGWSFGYNHGKRRALHMGLNCGDVFVDKYNAYLKELEKRKRTTAAEERKRTQELEREERNKVLEFRREEKAIKDDPVYSGLTNLGFSHDEALWAMEQTKDETDTPRRISAALRSIGRRNKE